MGQFHLVLGILGAAMRCVLLVRGALGTGFGQVHLVRGNLGASVCRFIWYVGF